MAGSTGLPHAVLFPYPAQGHIKPFMELAKVLSRRGIYITFVNTEHNEERILRSGSGKSSSNSANSLLIRFETIPDGLPPEHGRTAKVAELTKSLQTNGPLHFGRLMDKFKHSPDVPPVKCIIFDGVLFFIQNFAKEMSIPGIAFWTTSACGFLAYFSAPLLIEKHYIPLKDGSSCRNGSLEEVITCIPGMTNLRVKDLPTFFVTPSADFMFNYLVTAGQAAQEADLVILNTFDDLEMPVMEALRAKLPGLTLGPLLLAESEVEEEKEGNRLLSSLWVEETNYVEWLDAQGPNSVLYLSFGSMTVMSDEQLLEFAWGLEASKQPFLWNIRPDLIQGRSAVLPKEFLEKTRTRSFIVPWAPQMRILSHPSVGGFLTHSGWNSTLEAISAGVPMICWAFFAEQQTNRRFVSEVWHIGFEMDNVVERGEVEQMVKSLMNGREGMKMKSRVRELKNASRRAMSKGGSSHYNLAKLVDMVKGVEEKKCEEEAKVP